MIDVTMIGQSREVLDQRLRDVVQHFRADLYDALSSEDDSGSSKVGQSQFWSVIDELDEEFSFHPVRTSEMISLMTGRIVFEAMKRVDDDVRSLEEETGQELFVSEATFSAEGPDGETTQIGEFEGVRVDWQWLIPLVRSDRAGVMYDLATQSVIAFLWYNWHTGDPDWYRMGMNLMNAGARYEKFMGLFAFVLLSVYVEVVERGETPPVSIEEIDDDPDDD